MKKIVLILIVLSSSFIFSQNDASIPIIINEPASLSVATNPSITNVSAFGLADGEIDISVLGGNPGKTYLWSNGSTNEDLTNVGPGEYTVTVTDSKGCTTMGGPYTITEPLVLGFGILNSTPIMCSGDTNGSITARATGGYPDYKYQLQRETPSGSGTFIDFSAEFVLMAAENFFIDNLAPAKYKVKVIDDDGNGFEFLSDEIEIFPIAPLQFTAPPEDITPVFCIGASTGAINITVSGGTPGYSYQWSKVGDSSFDPTSEDIMGLTAGQYNVTIMDSQGCSISSSPAITISEPTNPLTITTPLNGVQNPMFNGASDGSIDIEVSGGTPGYTYSWSNGAITQDISGLADGTYTITVTDDKGCVVTETFTLSEPPPFVVSISLVQPILCDGDSTGSLLATASGGVPNAGSPYEYEWFQIIGTIETFLEVTTATISNLPAGVYKVEATDNNGNKTDREYTLSDPPILSFNSTASTNVSCFGGNDGTASVSVSGGEPGYSYTWTKIGDTEFPSVNMPTIPNLTAGEYKVVVTDSLGCSINTTVTVSEPSSPVTISLNSLTHVLISGQSTGAIDIEVTGGKPDYTYQWTKTTGDPPIPNDQEDLNNITAGEYTVQVFDSQSSSSSNEGCIASKTYIVKEPLPLSVTIVESDPILCFNENNGELTANASGGEGDYSYQWFEITNETSALPGETLSVINDLSKGEYQVKVTDSNGATADSTFVLTEPPSLVGTLVNSKDVLCFGRSTGAIDIDVTGGTGDYAYEWSDANGSLSIFTEDLLNIPAGEYSVVIFDDNNCEIPFGPFVISEPVSAMSISDSDVIITNLLGFQTGDGSISITVTGGTPNYTYEWRLDGTTPIIGNAETINNLQAGDYELTIIDDNGCTMVQVYTVTEPPLLEITSIDQITEIQCFNDKTAALLGTVSGGTLPYTYSWYNALDNTTILSTSNRLLNIGSGNYVLEIQDGNGIQASENYTVNEPPEIIATYESTQVSCKGGNDGSINISVTGGTGAYSFFWSNGDTMEDISELIAGNYSVTIRDENFCEDIMTITITEPALGLSITGNTIDATGNGLTNGSITVNPAGGTEPYSYVWTDAANTVLSSTTNILNNIGAGNYFLTVTDVNTCTLGPIEYSVAEPETLIINITETGISCFGETGELIAFPTGGTPPYSYQWFDIANTLISTTNSSESIISGIYSVLVTDNNNIQKTESYTLAEPSLLQIDAINPTHVNCYNGDDGSITISVVGGTGNYIYTWSNNGSTTNTQNGLTAGDYTVTVTDENNCSVPSGIITITEPALGLSITDNTIDATGNNLTNGSITVTVIGGTEPYNYVWTDAVNTVLGSTTNILDNVGAGSYFLTVTDAKACVLGPIEYPVTEPDALIISVTETGISCFGETGELMAFPTGGTPPYSYQWFDIANTLISTTNSSASIISGIYSVLVTDSNNIQKTESYTLAEPSLLKIDTISPTHVNCYNGDDGAITISVIGGTGNYIYTWSNNGSSTNTQNGLTAGDYTVTVTDENNCSVPSGIISISEPSVYDVISVSLIRPTGTISLDGSISTTITGGKTPYDYEWTDDTGTVLQTETNVNSLSSNITGLSEGLYTMTVTDVDDCTLIETYNLGNPGELLVSVEQTQPISCFGGSDGILNVITIGGAGGNNYVWHNAVDDSIIATSQVLTNLSAGVYYVVVSNAEGISEQSTDFIVTEPDAVLATVSQTNPSCFGFLDGSISLNTTGGTGSYEYRLRIAGNTYGIWISFGNGATTEINDLGDNLFEIQVRDTNQCFYEIESNIGVLSIDLTQPEPLLVSNVSSNNPTGFDLTNGSIEITLIGGTLPYTYQWSNSSGVLSETTNVLSNIGAGNYSVLVKDANDCEVPQDITISEPANLMVTIDQINIISCNGGSGGGLTANTQGGVVPYTYEWFVSGDTTVIGTTQLLENLGPNTYYVMVTDVKGNTSQSPGFIVTEPDAVLATVSQTNPSCFGFLDGSILLNATGGTNSYEYRLRIAGNTYGNWTAFGNGAATEINDLGDNLFEIQVRDTNNCFYESGAVIEVLSIDLVQPEALTIANVLSNDPTGFGLTNGSIEITSIGGTLPYTYQWSNSNGVLSETANVLSNIGAGNYSVLVKDTNGCEVRRDITISEPADLMVTIDQINIILCNGGSNGSLFSNSQGGVTPYTYEWFISGDATVIGTTQLLENLGPNTYYVMVMDANGNTTQSIDFIVTEPNIVSTTLSADFVLCGDDRNWEVTPTVTGGTPPFTYAWDNGDSTEILTDILPGTYKVTIIDSNGCRVTDSIDLIPPPPLTITSDILDPICFEGNDGLINLDTTGGTAPYTYLWSTGATSSSISGLAEGNYEVTITDSKGCAITEIYTVIDPLELLVDLGTDVTLCVDQTHTLDATIINGSSYQWNSNNGFTSDQAAITISEAGVYTVISTNNQGCIATGEVEVFSSNEIITAEFLVSTVVFSNESFVMFNISKPIADQVIWELPAEAQVIENTNAFAEILIETPGEYEITMHTIIGTCMRSQTKKVLVLEPEDLNNDPTNSQSPLIINYNIYPNPSDGNFTVDIELREIQPATIKIFGLINNAMVDYQAFEGDSVYQSNYNLDLSSGIYFMLLETPNAAELRKIIIE